MNRPQDRYRVIEISIRRYDNRTFCLRDFEQAKIIDPFIFRPTMVEKFNLQRFRYRMGGLGKILVEVELQSAGS